jgi:hypothetical protein
VEIDADRHIADAEGRVPFGLGTDLLPEESLLTTFLNASNPAGLRPQVYHPGDRAALQTKGTVETDPDPFISCADTDLDLRLNIDHGNLLFGKLGKLSYYKPPENTNSKKQQKRLTANGIRVFYHNKILAKGGH